MAGFLFIGNLGYEAKPKPKPRPTGGYCAVAVLALAVAPAFAFAQIAQSDTPPPFAAMRQEFGGDGSVYTLTSLGGHEVWFDLPFGLDFSAGWSVVVGKRTRDLDGLFQEVPAYGLEVYTLKTFTDGIGSGKPFVRLSLRALMDGDQPGGTRDIEQFRFTAAVSLGWRVD